LFDSVAPDDLALVAADEIGDLLARFFHALFGFPAVFVVAAVRIAEFLREKRHHRFEHARIHRRGRLVVEIDRAARRVRAVGSSGLGGGVHVSLAPVRSGGLLRLAARQAPCKGDPGGGESVDMR
jgi:hypothetical protein